jgi:hypothetical protein
MILCAAVVILLATSCNSLHRGSSFRAIASEPPVSAIELIKPASVSDMGATTTFPAGKYRPVYEDEHGYYFEAPSKVIVDDIGVYGFDGGVFIVRGKTAPTEWYLIRPNGRRSMGHFKTAPLFKAIP